MSLITITIDTEGAAFDDYDAEIADILKGLAAKAFMADLYDGLSVKDTNGNTCGRVRITEEGEEI